MSKPRFMTIKGIKKGDYVKCYLFNQFYDVCKILFTGIIPSLGNQPLICVEFVHNKLECRIIKGKKVHQFKIFDKKLNHKSKKVKKIKPVLDGKRYKYHGILLRSEIKIDTIIWSNKIEKNCYKLNNFDDKMFKNACWINNIKAIKHQTKLLSKLHNMAAMNIFRYKSVQTGIKKCIQYKHNKILESILKVVSDKNAVDDETHSVFYKSCWGTLMDHFNEKALSLLIDYDNWHLGITNGDGIKNLLATGHGGYFHQTIVKLKSRILKACIHKKPKHFLNYMSPVILNGPDKHYIIQSCMIQGKFDLLMEILNTYGEYIEFDKIRCDVYQDICESSLTIKMDIIYKLFQYFIDNGVPIDGQSSKCLSDYTDVIDLNPQSGYNKKRSKRIFGKYKDVHFYKIKQSSKIGSDYVFFQNPCTYILHQKVIPKTKWNSYDALSDVKQWCLFVLRNGIYMNNYTIVTYWEGKGLTGMNVNKKADWKDAKKLFGQVMHDEILKFKSNLRNVLDNVNVSGCIIGTEMIINIIGEYIYFDDKSWKEMMSQIFL